MVCVLKVMNINFNCDFQFTISFVNTSDMRFTFIHQTVSHNQRNPLKGHANKVTSGYKHLLNRIPHIIHDCKTTLVQTCASKRHAT